jgi:preprotein translocase subunit SecA
LWVDHLEAMEYLRSSVNLRAYGQRDPLVEYKKEGLRLFHTMEETYEMHIAQVLPNIVRTGAPETKSEQAVVAAAKSITSGKEGSGGSVPVHAYARNDYVVITNGTETQEMKYKKAEPLLASGEWRIVKEK